MCDWCLQHGEGKKWYLNIKNYSEEFLKDKAVVEDAIKFFQNTEALLGAAAPMTKYASDLKSDEEFSRVVAVVKETFNTMSPHRGQVVPLEDAKEIIKLAGPIARVACVCRRMLRASFEEKTCIPLGPVYLEYGREWPDFTRGGIDYISKEEAIELMEGFNEKGYVHTFWMGMESPAVLGFCNCEYPTCAAIRGRRYCGDWSNFLFRKAEYVAVLDYDECIGCGKCLSRCQFGAITYSPYLEKALFDMRKCFGCGLCRTVCDQGAIKLVPRSEVPAVRSLW